ncbi:MAG: hypothetical protein ACK40G_15970 [Cytophagaceae bacterium]
MSKKTTNDNKYCISINEIRKVERFKDLSDDEAIEIVYAIQQFALITYNAFTKNVENNYEKSS